MRNVSALLLAFFLILSLALPSLATTCNCQPGERCVGNNQCQKCDGGTYSPGGASTSCQDCKAGTFAKHGAAACSPCEDGFGSNDRSNQCQECSAGYYSINGSGCKKCDAGLVSKNKASSCYPCAAGYISNPSQNGCDSCSAGTYTDVPGLTVCKLCSPGYFQTKTAQTGCDICPCGTYSDRDKATTCENCGDSNNGRLTSNVGADSRGKCFEVKPGQYTTPDRCAADCPAGSFSSRYSATHCEQCSDNQVAPAGSASCTTCPTRTKPDASKTTCELSSTGGSWGKRSQKPFICPGGKTYCPVLSGRKRGAFDCVDTASNLLACGGCPGSGVDCTAFDSSATASCVNGQCHYQCPSGFNLTATGCQRATKQRKSRGHGRAIIRPISLT